MFPGPFQEVLGYIRKELAHGTGVLLDWKKNCDSGAVIAVAALMSENWLARLCTFVRCMFGIYVQ